MKTYKELITLKTFDERLEYLKLRGVVGDPTFGSRRYLNQKLYQLREWKITRQKIILRDNGCDLGIQDYPIYDSVFIHHINPITLDDIIKRRNCVFDLNNLICVSFKTHNTIHYGEESPYDKLVIRTAGDTCLWK